METTAETRTQVVILDSSSCEDIFVCGICKAVFNSLQLFVGHKKHSHNVIVQRNPVPQSSINHRNLYINPRPKKRPHYGFGNFETPHSNSTCRICDKKFDSLKYLFAHYLVHENPYQCQICGMLFNGLIYLMKHIDTHKFWPHEVDEVILKHQPKNLEKIPCLYCKAVLPDQEQLQAHMNIHMSQKAYKCIQGKCVKLFDTVEKLQNHVLDVHYYQKSYTCFKCKQVSYTLLEIAIHYETNCDVKDPNVTTSRIFECTLCDVRFKYRETLSLHMLSESHTKFCGQCKKRFPCRRRLAAHERTHFPNRQYRCHICRSNLLTIKSLETHVLLHTVSGSELLFGETSLNTGENIFICPFRDVNSCDQKYETEEDLKEHLKFHAKFMHLPETETKIVETDTVCDSIDTNSMDIVSFINEFEVPDIME